MLALFLPLIMSSGGNSGSQGTSLIIRALALREVTLRDWWRVAVRELGTGVTLGVILAVIGFARIELWQTMAQNGWTAFGVHLGHDYSCVSQGVGHLARCGVVNPHLVALTVALSLVGVVTFGTLAGSMLPFVLRRLGFDPASASAPFVATFVDVTGLDHLLQRRAAPAAALRHDHRRHSDHGPHVDRARSRARRRSCSSARAASARSRS